MYCSSPILFQFNLTTRTIVNTSVFKTTRFDLVYCIKFFIFSRGSSWIIQFSILRLLIFILLPRHPFNMILWLKGMLTFHLMFHSQSYPLNPVWVKVRKKSPFPILKGVFAKNERGYRLTSNEILHRSLLILLLSVASIRRKSFKTSNTQERSVYTNSCVGVFFHLDRKWFNF